MAKGKLPEDIIGDVVQDYQKEGLPSAESESKEDGMEFNPENLKIDPKLFESFDKMM